MIKARNTSMSRKSKPVADPGGDPAEAAVQPSQPQADEGYQNLDNQYLPSQRYSNTGRKPLQSFWPFY